MKALATFLLALTPLLPVTAADSEPACDVANEAVTEEALLADVLTVYEALSVCPRPEYLIESQEQEDINIFRESAEKIRPIVARLQQLPVENVKRACLLADAILYQEKWMLCAYLGEFGYDFEAPEDTGLCVVSDLFEKVLLYQQPDSAISSATRETLETFVAACGGGQAMNAVISWEADARSEQENERDYLAALAFFKAFCAAVSTENEEQCLRLLANRSRQLQQLSGGKNAELLRLNYLVPTFRSALIELWSDMCQPPKPYPNPVLPQALRTEPRMQALQPFFEQLPNLHTLVLDRATWQDAEPSAAPPVLQLPVYFSELSACSGCRIRLTYSCNKAPHSHTMNLKPFVCSALAVAALASPLVSAAEPQRIGESVAASQAALDTAFHEAVFKCFRSYRYDDSAMRELLHQGANINAVDAEGNNALMRLIKAADGHSENRIRKELFEFLRDAGIDLHARNKAGLNAAELNYCLYCPYEFLKKEFEQAGVPVCPGAQLSAAAAGSNVAEVERLLQSGADPNFNRACALLQCIGIITDGPQKNEVIIAALLLQAGAAPNLGGDSLMTRAVLSDNSEELVPLLLQHGFRVRDFDAETTGQWIEHLLVHRSPARVEIVNLLICHGAVLNDENWYTPFFCHMVTDGNGSYQDMQLARHFIELGLDATRKNEDGKSAYMLAREKKLGLGIQQILERPQAVLAELQQKAQVVDEAGRTQLMLAVADPHRPAIEVYKWLRAGVDVNARDAQGRTALFYINSFCPQKGLKAKLLIEAGADVNALDAQGRTPLLALPYVHDLRIPQQHSCAPIIRLLAEAGADLNACDKDGYTRLELMLRHRNLSLPDWECVQLLQQLGCSPRPERLHKQ